MSGFSRLYFGGIGTRPTGTYFEYTVEDELVRVYNDTVEVQFAYDGAGDRIQTKTITNSGLDTNIVKFSYDGSDLLYEHDESDAVVVKYLYGPGIDNILETEDQSGTYYHFGDALGSVSQTTDASGIEVASKVHDSFGRLMFTSGSSSGDRIGFTGREYEADLGIYCYRARYYDPNIGRFISQDPIGFAAGDLNLYRYVGNWPTALGDPLGLFWEELGLALRGYGWKTHQEAVDDAAKEFVEKKYAKTIAYADSWSQSAGSTFMDYCDKSVIVIGPDAFELFNLGFLRHVVRHELQHAHDAYFDITRNRAEQEVRALRWNIENAEWYQNRDQFISWYNQWWELLPEDVKGQYPKY